MKKISNCIPVIMLAFTGIWLSTGKVIADDTLPDMPGYVTNSVIDAHALSHVRGRFVVNMAAGDSNTQANAGAVALGNQAGSAVAEVYGMHITDPTQANLPDIATATIGNHAFAHSAGMISINQTSGVGNAQVNGAAFAIGFEEVTAESVLSATTSNAVPSEAGQGKGHQAVSIHDTAFEGSRGLVQVNQSAGSGNSTANNFALELQLGAKP